jgi:parallel beta-helix repeat protein
MSELRSIAVACMTMLMACGGGDGDAGPASGGDAATDDAATDDVGADATSSDAPTTDGSSGDSSPVDGSTPGAYPVYAGCAAPATSFTRTVYVDPSAGDTGDGSKEKPFGPLATTLAKKKIAPGDHVVLLPGDHGAVQVSKYSNPELAASTKWIWLDFQAGAKAKGLTIGDMAFWLVTRAEVSADRASTKNALYTVTSSHDVVLADAHLYTVADSKSWTANEWINTAADGVFLRNGSCLSVVRTKVLNSRFGIAILSDGKARPDTSMKVLVQGNEIANFSGDGLRPIASDVTIKDNYVHDVYVNAADGDDNHDDGLQMWALGGATYDNIRIEGNWVQETTDAKRPLQNDLQGISQFDGVSTHVVITNNVVLAGAYHGIALYGCQDSTIDHNTVANPGSNGHQLWVGVFDLKDGSPSKNLTVTDNAATTFSFSMKTTGFVNTNNIAVPDPTTAYTTFDKTTLKFDLTPKAGSMLAGKGAGSSLTKPPASLP